jgi:hypothetical protein
MDRFAADSQWPDISLQPEQAKAGQTSYTLQKAGNFGAQNASL